MVKSRIAMKAVSLSMLKEKPMRALLLSEMGYALVCIAWAKKLNPKALGDKATHSEVLCKPDGAVN